MEAVAHPKGFEPLTPRFVVWCSIQLSYGCVLRARTYWGASPKASTTVPAWDRMASPRPNSLQVPVETCRFCPKRHSGPLSLPAPLVKTPARSHLAERGGWGWDWVPDLSKIGRIGGRALAPGSGEHYEGNFSKAGSH